VSSPPFVLGYRACAKRERASRTPSVQANGDESGADFESAEEEASDAGPAPQTIVISLSPERTRFIRVRVPSGWRRSAMRLTQ
jgi:hypothetical protein